ncbi:class I SAM-dependent methyltransferase [Methylocella silvestris]|nr:methyltransferase domain-containing protein [Methylocella silvestris]
MLAYDFQTVKQANPLARFAHKQRIERSVMLAQQYLAPNGVIVDFGAGKGSFLTALGDKRPDATLYAIEEYFRPAEDSRIHYVENFKSLEVKTDLVTSFEVGEHLTDAETEEFLTDARQSLKDGGKLIISVPIMIGAACALKDLNRALMFRRAPEYSLRELIAGSFGGAVQRPADRRPTHKGFDFRWLRDRIENYFLIENEILSPLPLPWWVNSQIFFICRKK